GYGGRSPSPASSGGAGEVRDGGGVLLREPDPVVDVGGVRQLQLLGLFELQDEVGGGAAVIEEDGPAGLADGIGGAVQGGLVEVVDQLHVAHAGGVVGELPGRGEGHGHVVQAHAALQ